MNCRTCENEIETERLEVLPYTVQCSKCAHKYNLIQPRKGIMVFTHKTGGELQTMSADFYSKNKKYFVANGARSVVKNFSRNVCA
jgi:RNA polymerase-binding transcription factor DksA